MVGELEVTLNKEVVMVHCGDHELWVDKEHLLTSVDFNIFTEFFSKTAVQLWLQDFPTENRDPGARLLKPRDFVADGGI